MASHGGGGNKFKRWDSNPSFGGRGGRSTSSFGGRSSFGGGRDGNRFSSGCYQQQRRFHEHGGVFGEKRGRSRSPPGKAGSGWGKRSRSRSPGRFDKAPPMGPRSNGPRFRPNDDYEEGMIRE